MKAVNATESPTSLPSINDRRIATNPRARRNPIVFPTNMTAKILSPDSMPLYSPCGFPCPHRTRRREETNDGPPYSYGRAALSSEHLPRSI